MDNFILYVLFDIVVKYMTEHPKVIRKFCEIIWDIFLKPFIQESAKILANRIFKSDKEKAYSKKRRQKIRRRFRRKSLYAYKLSETEEKHDDNRKLEDDKKRVFMYIQRQIVKDNKMYKRYNPNCLMYLGTVSIRVK